jgi:hypothetical protein
VGLAYNNYYIRARVANHSIQDTGFTYSGYAGYGLGFPFSLDTSKTYTISYNVSNSNSTGLKPLSILYYQNDGTYISNDNNNYAADSSEIIKNFTPVNNSYYTVIDFYGQDNDVITITNVQLEEGEEATAYEPYYLSNDTKVVQTGNHTLKAIWQANS